MDDINNDIKDLELKTKVLGQAYEFSRDGLEHLKMWLKMQRINSIEAAKQGHDIDSYVPVDVVDYVLQALVDLELLPFFQQEHADAIKSETNITLNYDDTANTLTINSTASGGSGDGWTYVYLNEDFIVNNGANYLHLTPFYIPMPPNSNYEIETTLLFTTTLTTDGLGLTTEFSGMDGTNRSNITASLTSTQSKNWGSSGYNNNVTTTSIAGLNIALLSSFIFNNNILNTIYKILLRQNITNGTSVVTIKVGSFVKYRTIG